MSRIRRGWRIDRVRYLATSVALCGLSTACADSRGPATRPASARERQEQALRDPFGYGPQNEEMPSVSGGGTKDLDKKGIKRDWDRFWGE